jgi:hypothetical protein
MAIASLLARGHSFRVASSMLGIHPDVAKNDMENARVEHDARNTMEIVVRMLRDGYINFPEKTNERV